MKKKIYFGALIALMLFALGACKKQQDLPVKPVPSTVFTAVLQDNPPFTSAKTVTNINIVAGTNGWYLTQVPANTWCVPQKQFGAGDFSLGLTINANTTGADRTTQITLTSTNKNLPPVTLNVTQSK